MPVKNYTCAISGTQARLTLICTFPGLPGTYRVEEPEHILEVLQDPTRFAADLAGLSCAEYLDLLGGEPCTI